MELLRSKRNYSLPKMDVTTTPFTGLLDVQFIEGNDKEVKHIIHITAAIKFSDQYMRQLDYAIKRPIIPISTHYTNKPNK